MTNEQIQALKAAAESTTPGEWAIQFGDEIYASDGVNHDQIAMLFSDNSARDAEFIAAANPSVVLSLLAERDADKALIAEQAKRIAELEGALNLASASYAGERERADALQARKLTVKLLEGYKPHVQKGGTQSTSYRAVLSGKGPWIHRDMLIEACAAAGITLVVGE